MILVVGATGAVGESVVRTLRRFGAETRALVRSGSEYFWLNDSGTQFFFGDLRDPTSLNRASANIQSAIVCVDLRIETRDNNYQHLINGLITLTEALGRKGCQKIVLISCLGVELDLPVPAFKARQQFEEIVSNSGINYTILRTPPHEGYFVRLAAQEMHVPTSNGNVLNAMSTQDIALIGVASLDSPASTNRTMALFGPHPLSARGLYETACQNLNTPRTPKYTSQHFYSLMKQMKRPFRRYANRWAETSIWFNRDFTGDAAKIENVFGIKLSPVEPAIKHFAQNYHIRNTPELREQHMVHPQFYATVYAPGTAKVSEMPKGPIRPESESG